MSARVLAFLMTHDFSWLAPAEWIYRRLAARRRRHFAEKPPVRSAHCRVISVGNLTVGGTGKTPAVQLVARVLQQNGARVAVVSRGYGGAFSKRGAIVSDGKTIFCSAREAGDEPLLHARALPNVPVVVGIDRVRAAQTAMEKFSPDCVVLDDAFGFVSLHRDLDLVLLDARHPVGNGHLLPRGTLREEVVVLRRAGAVLLTRANFAAPHELAATRELVRKHCDAPIFACEHAPAKLYVVNNEFAKSEIGREGVLEKRNKCREYSLDWLCEKTICAASALADNAAFGATLESLGARVINHCARRDHHAWRAEEIVAAAREGASRGALALLVTEKDAVKIAPRAVQNSAIPILALRVELRVTRGEDELRALICQAAKPPRASTRET